MTMRITRRKLLRNAALAGTAVWTARGGLARGAESPNEKLDVAVVGCGGRGASDLAGVSSENIVALCDVDEARAGKSFERYPQAEKYKDFRRMLDEVGKRLDAVVVGTPDHTHAAPSAAALRLGKHVYCEKPLTHNVCETRVLTDLAVENKLATQLGTQIHAGDNYRRAVELVQSGAIGPVGEVHVWLGGNFDHKGPWPDSTPGGRPTDKPPVPDTLDWDLWLGPAPFRPYHSAYCPFAWRYWWAFANGRLGDFFCHYCDLAFWALKLKYPTTVESQGPAVNPEKTPQWTISRQEYPAREGLPPVTLTWYHGGPVPEIAQQKNVPHWRSAVLFVGRDGMLIADYGKHLLLPQEKYADFKPPEPSIPRSIGHHQEWIRACKTGEPTTCNFAYSGPLTEAALLANVSLRVGKKITWDAAKLKAVDCPEADQFLRREYREGWKL